MGTAAALVRAKAFGVFRDSPTHALIARGRSNTTDPVFGRGHRKAALSPNLFSAHNRHRGVSSYCRTSRLRSGGKGQRLRADRIRTYDNLAAIVILVGLPWKMQILPACPSPQCRASDGVAGRRHGHADAATDAGLSSSIMWALLFRQDTVRDACVLPPDWEPQTLVTVGHPANAGKPIMRRSLSSVVRYPDVAQ